MARTTPPVAEPETAQTWQDEEGNEHPFEDGPSGATPTVIAYDANGDSYDAPVDTTPAVQTGLPGVEKNEPLEMFDGRQVTAWKYSVTGNTQVSRRNIAASNLFESMRAETPVTLLVTVVPGAVSYKPNTEDGHVVGFTRERKLHVTDVWAADADASDLFEGGLVRTRTADDIGFLTEDPGDDVDDVTLEGMLAETLAPEPGMCSKLHRGHLSPCRQPAHACDLPTADEAE